MSPGVCNILITSSLNALNERVHSIYISTHYAQAWKNQYDAQYCKARLMDKRETASTNKHSKLKTSKETHKRQLSSTHTQNISIHARYQATVTTIIKHDATDTEKCVRLDILGEIK